MLLNKLNKQLKRLFYCVKSIPFQIQQLKKLNNSQSKLLKKLRNKLPKKLLCNQLRLQ